MMPRPDAVFFDWDGTLTEGFDAIFNGHNEALRHFGLPPLSQEDLRLQIRLSGREAYPKIFGDRWQEALDIFKAYVTTHHLEHIKAIAGSDQVLQLLSRKGIIAGVISNKTHAILEREIDHLGWRPYFRAVVGAGLAAKDKPSAEPVWLAAEQAGINLKTQMLWYIGDTEVDILTARAAGCKAIFIGHGLGQLNHLAQSPPDLSVYDHADLIKYLQTLI